MENEFPVYSSIFSSIFFHFPVSIFTAEGRDALPKAVHITGGGSGGRCKPPQWGSCRVHSQCFLGQKNFQRLFSQKRYNFQDFSVKNNTIFKDYIGNISVIFCLIAYLLYMGDCNTWIAVHRIVVVGVKTSIVHEIKYGWYYYEDTTNYWC